jgi:hypothetical protein
VEFDAALDAAMDLIRNATVTITYADGDAPHAITKVRPCIPPLPCRKRPTLAATAANVSALSSTAPT